MHAFRNFVLRNAIKLAVICAVLDVIVYAHFVISTGKMSRNSEKGTPDSEIAVAFIIFTLLLFSVFMAGRSQNKVKQNSEILSNR